eukprot:gene20651-26774_t
MNLDALLDDAANTVLEPVSKPTAPVTAVPAEIKPWLASSANVPKEFRDKWNKYVKLDRNAKFVTRLQPSNSYRSLENLPINSSKLLNELIRKASTQLNYDDIKSSKIISIINPVTENDYSKFIQLAYAKQIINDLKSVIEADPNYDPIKYPNLAKALVK